MTTENQPKQRMAIIGAGCSGLVTLKFALERLPEWDITCYEATSNVTGSWGYPHDGFVSTSTKFTTQFACFREFSASVKKNGAEAKAEFFRDGEFGAYLERFVRAYKLHDAIVRNCPVERVEQIEKGWHLTLGTEEKTVKFFDVVIVCTGLARKPKPLRCSLPLLNECDDDDPVRNKRIVVVGGGESAVDLANRFANPTLGNHVYLSLGSGVRVSPRYHPIRGVPSDFLRNRLLSSIHENIRNAVGQKFVQARIRFEKQFETFFRSAKKNQDETERSRQKKRYWGLKLMERAKDDLFNMFHNKSDDFLDAVADDRLSIVGRALDESMRTFTRFDREGLIEVDPDFVVPSIGYESNLAELSGDALHLQDFYLGCVHAEWDDIFLVGFARPIIGNIPSISEMQARYVIGLVAGDYARMHVTRDEIRKQHGVLRERYAKINTRSVYPVDMMPYCDRLARLMGMYPYMRELRSMQLWLKVWLTPYSTMQYLSSDFDSDFLKEQKVYAPALITVLLLLVKLFDMPYTAIRGQR